VNQSGDRRLKKLALKVGYLREELYDLEEEFDRRGWQLQRAVMELLARAGELLPPRPAAPIEQSGAAEAEDDQEPAQQQPAWQRKLFRKISSKTHPDALLREELSEREQVERAKMFQDAHKAMQKGDGGRLVEIAAELDIEIDDAPMEEHIKSMESLAIQLESRTQEIKRTAAWIWGEGKRHEILNHVGRVSGWSGSPTNLIDDVIAWVDAGFVGGLNSYSPPPAPEARRFRGARKIGQRPERMLRSR
jgi:hypothetical protein